MPINDCNFDELRQHAQEYARTHNVSVELYRDSVESSSVSAGGMRIELFVFREIPGQSSREHPCFNYSPGVQDLKARIERDIRRAALELHAP